MKKVGMIISIILVILILGIGIFFIVSSIISEKKSQHHFDKPNIYIYNKDFTIDKPNIYTYNKDKNDIEISLKLKNTNITCVYPKGNYNKKLNTYTWNILTDNNKIIYKNKKYNYLYYEAITNNKLKINEGFCVKKENLISFLEEKLTLLGLSEEEQNDFITYWLPKLQKYKYCLISFDKKQYNNSVELKSKPEADQYIRVFMLWKGLNKKQKIKEQKINKCIRNNNDLLIVEWGGSKL